MLVLTLKVGSTLHIGEGTLKTVRVRANNGSHITLASGPASEHLIEPDEPLDFEGASLQVTRNARNRWVVFIDAPDDILITYR